MSIIAKYVDRGLEIRSEIAQLLAELETIEAFMKQAGLRGEQVPLEDADREGRQFIAEGTEQIVPVVFTADLLVKSFGDGTAMHAKIEAASGGHLDVFFKKVTTHKGIIEDGKAFRTKAAEVLGTHGPYFVSACLQRDRNGIPKSQVRVEWERAKPLVEVPAS